MTENFNHDDLEEVVKAILTHQNNIQWKIGKAENHLIKRIRLGHLPKNSALADYEAIIYNISTDRKAKVYVYIYDQILYPALTTVVGDKLWLVMIGIDGVLETAFPPERPERYLSNNSFVYLGTLGDLLP